MKKIFFLFLSVSFCFGQTLTLDPSFDADGKVTTPIVAGLNSIYDIALQTDGKIVAVGYALTGVNYDIAISRYHTNGGIDSTFNSTGIKTIDLGFNDDVAYGVAIQADGKIVVAGSASNISNTDFIIIRLNSDGSMDNSFDADGMVFTNFDISYETAYDVAIQSDGKIVAAGSAFMDTVYNFAVARYNTNGSLDASFGTGGKVTTLLANGDEGKSIALQSDGKIVLAGLSKQVDFSIAFGVARYNPNGTLDPSFNTTGKVVTSVSTYNDEARAVALQADGKIVVAGKGTPVGPEQFAVVRYNTDGSLDNTWNGTGMILTAFGSTWDEARSILIQPDGMVIAGGMASVGGQKYAMARYTTAGTLDPGFGTGGKLTTTFGSSASIWSMVQQPDTKIIAAGYSGAAANYDFALARYSSGKMGVEDFGISDYSIHVYPNPVAQNLSLEFTLQHTEKITIQLIGLDGKIAATYLNDQTTEPGKYQQNYVLPEFLPVGTYFIVISSANGSASVKVAHQ